MKITIEKEVKTVQEAYDFIATLLLKKEEVRVEVSPKVAATIQKRYPAIPVETRPVRNYDSNKEILKYVREAGRKGVTTEDMARDLANLGAGKNPFYFAQKAYELLSRRRLARFTGENGRYVYLMPYYRRGVMVPKPIQEEPKAKRLAVRKFSRTRHNGAKEVAAAAQLVLEERKDKGALFQEIRDLARPGVKNFSPNYTSAAVSYMKKKGFIVARNERIPGTSNRYRYYLPEYAPEAFPQAR